MNSKLTTLGLALVAVASFSLAPVEARNNNQQALLNQMAMNNYLNQANAQAALNPAYNSIYNPLQANLAAYNQPMGGNYSGRCDRDRDGDRDYDRDHDHGLRGFTNSNGWGNGWGRGNKLSQEISKLQTRLASGNLPAWESSRLQNKLAQLQAQSAGNLGNINPYQVQYSAPYGYGYNRLNGVRNFLGI